MTENDYRALLEELLTLDCTTGNEFNISKRLEQFHLETNDSVHLQEVQPKRFNVFSFDTTNSGKRVMFSTHIDTVPPHLEWRHEKETDCYYGRGACDTKGGLITMLMAAEELRQQNIAVDFCWVVGEETDHIGAINAVPFYQETYSKKYTHEGIILCEPTDNRLAKAQKGILKAEITFTGKMAHSGYPHLGDDANKKMIRCSANLYELADSLKDEAYGDFDLNIGLIEGGCAANVISDRAKLTFLARTNGNHRTFKSKALELLDDSMHLTWVSDNPPIPFEHVESLAYENTYVAKFNTDVKYFSELAPVYLMGPGYIIHAHAPKEHIFWKEMMEGKKLYINIVNDILNI